MAKIKTCSVCGRDTEKLWRSKPPVCSPRCDSTLTAEQKGKKQIEGVFTGGREGGKTASIKLSGLNVFYASQALVMTKDCENCGKPLNAWSSWHKRCVTAHILPKSTFPSVALHPQNKMFLGTLIAGSGCSCHDDYDRKDAKDREQMNCYKIALSRLQEFKDLLTPKEQVQAEKYLNIEL